ncbi:MAG: hypothetical protein K5656_02565, partial [Lachnospiraceae bacterium]|nr:hypothetical protein [Lachnospiraceae bacterium]
MRIRRYLLLCISAIMAFGCVGYVSVSKVTAAKKKTYRQYCNLEVGESEELDFEVDIPYDEISWESDSSDVIIEKNNFNRACIKAVKCSGKKRSQAIVTGKYKNIVLRCEVVIYAASKYKYKIVPEKGKKELKVGETKKFCVKTQNGKKIKNVKWFVKQDGSSESIKVNKNGEATGVKFKYESPTHSTICAEFGYIHLECKLDVYAKRDKKELEALKKIISRTNLKNYE